MVGAEEVYRLIQREAAGFAARLQAAAAELWGMTPHELREVQRNLAELQR